MDFDQLYPSRFMKAGEFQGRDLTLMVTEVRLEELTDGKEKETKVIIGFSNAKKRLVCNKTNGTCFRAMFGRETDQWIGKRVTLFPAPITDPFTGEATIAIRVRGSPDLPQTTQYTAKIGRKQVTFTLQRTVVPGKDRPTKAVAKAAAVPPPATVPSHGEPPDDVVLPGQSDPAQIVKLPKRRPLVVEVGSDETEEEAIARLSDGPPPEADAFGVLPDEVTP